MRLVFSVLVSALLIATAAVAQPAGTFRHAHGVGFGNLSSLDPISTGRVLQITEKIMNRSCGPIWTASPAPTWPPAGP